MKNNSSTNNGTEEEKTIVKHVLLQSIIVLEISIIVIIVLQQCLHLFNNHTGWDMLLVSLAIGYAYYVISIAWKGLLFSTSIDCKKIRSKGIICIGLSIVMIWIYYIYWLLPAFMYDKDHVQFGTFIFSGVCIFISYTIGVWVYYLRRGK
jgi:hypothetical protein